MAPITRFSISRNRLQSMYTFPFVRTFWLLKIMFSFTLISLNHLDFTFLICPLIFYTQNSIAKTPSNSGRFNCFESNENWNENLATVLLQTNNQTENKPCFNPKTFKHRVNGTRMRYWIPIKVHSFSTICITLFNAHNIMSWQSELPIWKINWFW